MNSIAESQFALPPLTGPWQTEHDTGTYAIHFDLNDVREALAAIRFNGTESYWPAQWKLPIISRAALTKVVASQPSDVQVEVSKKGGSFKVILHSITLENEQLSIIKALNAEIFSRDTARLTLHANWCREEADKSEREKFLLSIIFSSKEAPQKAVAASNAITILKTAGFCLAGLSFEGVRIPYADLSKIVLEKTNFKDAYLKGVNFTNAYLNGASWEGADVSTIELGQLPHLVHNWMIKQAAVTPDGKFLLSLGTHTLLLWDLIQASPILERKVRSIFSEKTTLKSFSFSYDGQFTFTNDTEGNIHILESNTLTKMLSYSTALPLQRIYCTPDGKYLLSYGSRVEGFSFLEMWKIIAHIHLESHKALELIGEVQDLCTSSSSSHIALKLPESVVVVSLRDFKIVANLYINSVEFLNLPNLNTYVSPYREFWSIEKYLSFYVYAIQFSADGNCLFISAKLATDEFRGRCSIFVWSWNNKQLSELLAEEEKDIYVKCLYPTKQQLFFTTSERHIGFIDFIQNSRRRDFYDPHIESYSSAKSDLTLIKHSSVGDAIIGMLSNVVIIWKKQNIENCSTVVGLNSVVDFVFSTDSSYLLLAHSQRHLRTYEAITGNVVSEKEFKKPYSYPYVKDNGISYFSTGGHYLISQLVTGKNTTDDFEITGNIPPPKTNNLQKTTRHNFRPYQQTQFLDVASEKDQPISSIASHVIDFAWKSHHLVRISERHIDFFRGKREHYVMLSSEKQFECIISNIKNPADDYAIRLKPGDGHWHRLAVSDALFPKGYIGVTRDSELFICELVGSEEFAIVGEKSEEFYSHITSLAFSCGYFVVQILDGKIFLIDVKGGKTKIREGDTNNTMRLAVAKERPLLAGCTIQRELAIHFWNIETSKKLMEIAISFRPIKLCFSPDGTRFAAWAPTHFFSIWDTSRLEEKKITLLWRLPQTLEAERLILSNVNSLSAQNREILNQLEKAKGQFQPIELESQKQQQVNEEESNAKSTQFSYTTDKNLGGNSPHSSTCNLF